MDLIRLIMNRACVLLPHVVLLQYIDGMDGMVQVFKCFMVDLICTTTVLDSHRPDVDSFWSRYTVLVIIIH